MTFAHSVNKDLSLEAVTTGNLTGGKGLYAEAKFTLFKVEGTKRTQAGSFSFSPMPGCCGVVVSHTTFLNPKERGTSISEPFRQLKTALARHLGYSCIIATSQENNPASIANMTKSGYAIGGRFVNSRTRNPIAIGIKVL